MFGTAPTTPFMKPRGAVVSQSFGQMSSAKRKRDQLSSTNEKKRIDGCVKGISAVPLAVDAIDQSSSRVKGYLFVNGDLIQLQSQSVMFHRNVIKPISKKDFTRSLPLSGTKPSDFEHFVDLGPGMNDSTDIVSSSRDGSLSIICVSAADDSLINLSLKIHLREEEDESISCICHAGNVLLLGTTLEEVYLVRRYGRSLNADRLLRNRNMWVNLLRTGAKYIGILPSNTDAGGGDGMNDTRIVKILPVPMSYLMLAVGSQTLSLWSDWTNPGSERVVWASHLRDYLHEDVTRLDLQPIMPQRQTPTVQQQHVVDACLMAVQPGAERAVLLVLSVTTVPQQRQSGGSSSSSSSDGDGDVGTSLLWLHTLEVQLPIEGASSNSNSAGADNGAYSGSGQARSVTTLHRMLVAESIVYIAKHDPVAVPNYVAPQISSLTPSWRIFITWTAAASSPNDTWNAYDTTGGSGASASKRMSPVPPRLQDAVGSSNSNNNNNNNSSHKHNSLHAVQCDILNQPLLNTTAVALGEEPPLESASPTAAAAVAMTRGMTLTRKQKAILTSIRCQHAVDTGIDPSTIVGRSAVRGVDGVCVVNQYGTVSVICPTLPNRTVQSFPTTYGTKSSGGGTVSTTTSASSSQLAADTNQIVSGMVRDRHVLPASSSTRVHQVETLLLHTALGEGRATITTELPLGDAVITSIRDAFAANSVEDIAGVILRVSSKILSRSPKGDYWGNNSSSSAGADVGGSKDGSHIDTQRKKSNNSRWQQDETTGQLTKYQLVHTLVTSKLDAHKRLIDLVASTDVYTYPVLQSALLEDHQCLLLCAGLSGAIEEAQLRLSKSVSSDNFRDDMSFELLGQQSALEVVAEGMSQCVQNRGVRLQDIDGKGLSVVDVFYSQASRILDGVEAIVNTLSAVQPSLLRRGSAMMTSTAGTPTPVGGGSSGAALCFEAAFHISSMVLSAVQYAQVGEGAARATTNINCTPSLRKSMLRLVGILNEHASSSSGGSGLVVGEATSASSSSDVTHNKQGKRVRELCALLLSSYSLEESTSANTNASAISSPPPSSSSSSSQSQQQGHKKKLADFPTAWKESFHHAKSICVSLLLRMHNYLACFQLSREFLFCEGLMQSLDGVASSASVSSSGNSALSSAPHNLNLQHQLEELIREHGAEHGSDTMPLAISCFLWLEKENRPADILSLGKHHKPLLTEFLQSRPHLSWMHSINSAQYAAAAAAAVEHADTVQSLSKATTLLSIAKLSAKLAIDGASSKPSALHAGIAAGGATRSGSSLAEHEKLDRTVASINAHLAANQAQKILQKSLLAPATSNSTSNNISNSGDVDTDARMNISDLITRTTASLESCEDPQVSAKADSDELVRSFGVCLGLLSMQLDLLDSLRDNAMLPGTAGDDTPYPNGATPATSYRGMTPSEIHKQYSSLSDLLVALWAALISANTVQWLELTSLPSLGGREEQMLREDCWLFQAVLNAAPEATGGNLRPELLPSLHSAADANTTAAAMGDSVTPGTNTAGVTKTLLRDAVASSQITHKSLDEQGRVVRMPLPAVAAAVGGAPSAAGREADGINIKVKARVEFLIHTCIELALSEAQNQHQQEQ